MRRLWTAITSAVQAHTAAVVLLVGAAALLVNALSSFVSFDALLMALASVGKPLALTIGGMLTGTIGLCVLLRKRKPITRSRKPLKTLPWWVVLFGAIAVVASIWTTTAVLLAEADVVTGNVLELAKLRSEAIRTGLTVGVGTGGAIALLLSVRRQWLNERTQQHQEEVSAVTELYAKAVEQLGSDKAPVRLAALYALERLADDHAGQRQTIVNVICAYLRMPFEFHGDPESAQEYEQEKQVRSTAQRIIAAHLGHLEARNVLEWHDIDIDLSGAVLFDVDFRGCRMRSADFRHAEFWDDALFGQAIFDGNAYFSEATFHSHADFGWTEFNGDAWFLDATFQNTSYLAEATFSGLAWFAGARFAAESVFTSVAIKGEAWFDRARFDGIARFDHTSFSNNADFRGVSFSEELWMEGASFERVAAFQAAKFKLATFEGAQFKGAARFKGADFVELSIAGSRFYDSMEFAAVTFKVIETEGCQVFGAMLKHSLPWKLHLLASPDGSSFSPILAQSARPVADNPKEDKN
ncbi:pentapeptide repeat-containing protein [Nonomuraea dietziae]|uniref:pentapeptide repeat-containing protein n=1 Tax=Nonomuraea dietziae TaxID=65515 RepID=UPI003438FB2E